MARGRRGCWRSRTLTPRARPRASGRSAAIIFLWNGGEEKGLLGSQYFAEFPPVDITKVVADLNMDMIGRTKNANSVDIEPTHVLVKPGEMLMIGPNISSDDLGKTIDTVNASYQKLKINHFYDVTAPDETHDNLGPQPQRAADLLSQRSLQFRQGGRADRVLHDRAARGLSPSTDTPEKIDYKEDADRVEDGGGGGLGTGEPGGPSEAERETAGSVGEGHEDGAEQGWGKMTPVMAPLPGEPY